MQDRSVSTEDDATWWETMASVSMCHSVHLDNAHLHITDIHISYILIHRGVPYKKFPLTISFTGVTSAKYHLQVNRLRKSHKYYNSTTWVGIDTCFFPAHVAIVINISRVWCAIDNCNVCWKEPGVISKPCGGIFLTPFHILKMVCLKNIRIQVKS